MRTADLYDKNKSFEDILKEWPQYKRKKIYALLDIDFNSLFPSKDTFKDLWSKYRKSILELGLAQKNNAELKRKMNLTVGVLDEERNLEGILALHALFHILPNKNKSAKKSLDKLLLLAKPGTKLQAILVQCSEKATSNNFSPIVIYYEDENFVPYKFYTCINDIIYETDIIVSAVDLLFKAIMVFDLAYADEVKVICTFIQNFFFDIFFETDFRGSSLIKCMAKINKEAGQMFEKRVLSKDFDIKIKGGSPTM